MSLFAFIDLETTIVSFEIYQSYSKHGPKPIQDMQFLVSPILGQTFVLSTNIWSKVRVLF